MRISDWSSDVCSSDLWWCAALDRGEPYPLFGDQLVADETAARTWFERHRPENDWSTLAVPATWEANRATQVDLAEILSRGGGSSLEPVRRGLPVSLGRVAAGIAAIRSEEHTSELQSLMRNSYA